MEEVLNINGIPKIPKPKNAAMVNFEEGSKERKLLEKEIRKIRESKPIDLPLLIGDLRLETDGYGGGWGECVVPHDKNRILGRYALAREYDVRLAADVVIRAQKKWAQVPWYIRLNIFRKAAYLLQTKYFYRLTAATMEDYSKNPFEAMIDVCELIDFWNFNAYYAYEIYQEQPDSDSGDFNFENFGPLEGFVLALPPNNFISIAANLPTAPIIMGNVAICKPSAATIYTFHIVMEILHEAGLPKDVLSVIHGDSEMIGNILLTHPHLAGVHFTGSTETFEYIWETIGKNIKTYRSYPRIVGETGGKDFMVVYDDADPKTVATAMVVSGFGYQGRKCSALSRVYISEEMWKKVKPFLLGFMRQIKVGDVANFRNYMGAVITEQEYKKVVRYIEDAQDDQVEVIGGNLSIDLTGQFLCGGWFVGPTLVITTDPAYSTMVNEIFGPVITICVLDQETFDKKALDLCDKTSPYALTGSVLTKDVFAFCSALQTLRNTAGNIYNWKTTGAVVGKQPFGGGRKSGTDDKAGSKFNLVRWIKTTTISLLNDYPEHFTPAYLDLE